MGFGTARGTRREDRALLGGHRAVAAAPAALRELRDQASPAWLG